MTKTSSPHLTPQHGRRRPTAGRSHGPTPAPAWGQGGTKTAGFCRHGGKQRGQSTSSSPGSRQPTAEERTGPEKGPLTPPRGRARRPPSTAAPSLTAPAAPPLPARPRPSPPRPLRGGAGGRRSLLASDAARRGRGGSEEEEEAEVAVRLGSRW